MSFNISFQFIAMAVRFNFVYLYGVVKFFIIND